MKKGSKALRCHECGKICGYTVPTGKFHHGIEEVKFQMKPGCAWTVKGFHQINLCADHNKLYKEAT